MDFQDLLLKIKSYYHKRNLKWPQPKDAAIFLSCESAEVLDACMRIENGWVRNNPKPVDLGSELGDVLMMVLVLADSVGVDPVESLLTKMEDKLKNQSGSFV